MLFEDIQRWMTEDDFSFEAIDFQPDRKFGEALEAEIDSIKEGRISASALHKSRLGEIIEKYTGMAVDIKGHQDYELYMSYDNMLVKNHPFISWQREYLSEDKVQKIMRKHGELEFSVDLRKGRVVGLSDDIRHIVGIGAKFLKSRDISTRHLVAGILHEVGHWLGVYEWMSRTLSTNYLLTDFTQRLLNTNEEEKRLRLVTEAKKAAPANNPIFQDTEQVTTEKQAQTIIILGAVQESKRELGLDIYTTRGWEQLADQYAARWGYALESMELLESIYKEYGITRFEMRWRTLHSELVLVILTGIGIALGSVAASAIGLFFILVGIAVDSQEEEYDSPQRRFVVIRKQMVAQLKETKDPKMRAYLLDRLDKATEIIEKAADPLSLFVFLEQRLGFINGRRVHRHITTQKLLEDLANSEFHVAAARLEE